MIAERRRTAAQRAQAVRGGPRGSTARSPHAAPQVDDWRGRSLEFLFPEACRYRLGVRTRGSQPRDRGSNPRTGTNLRSRLYANVAHRSSVNSGERGVGCSCVRRSYGRQAKRAQLTGAMAVASSASRPPIIEISRRLEPQKAGSVCRNAKGVRVRASERRGSPSLGLPSQPGEPGVA